MRFALKLPSVPSWGPSSPLLDGAVLPGILKGITNISMCDEVPQITSPQHFRDIVAASAHYHNVTATA